MNFIYIYFATKHFGLFSKTLVVITLDLSKLNELWTCMEKLIDYLHKRIHECVKKACKEQPQLKEVLKSQIHKRIGENPVIDSIFNNKSLISN